MFWKNFSKFQYHQIEKKNKKKHVITSNIDFNNPTKSSFWVVKVEECHQIPIHPNWKYPKGFPISQAKHQKATEKEQEKEEIDQNGKI